MFITPPRLTPSYRPVGVALQPGAHHIEHQAVGTLEHEVADFNRAAHVNDDVSASG